MPVTQTKAIQLVKKAKNWKKDNETAENKWQQINNYIRQIRDGLISLSDKAEYEERLDKLDSQTVDYNQCDNFITKLHTLREEVNLAKEEEQEQEQDKSKKKRSRRKNKKKNHKEKDQEQPQNDSNHNEKNKEYEAYKAKLRNKERATFNRKIKEVENNNDVTQKHKNYGKFKQGLGKDLGEVTDVLDKLIDQYADFNLHIGKGTLEDHHSKILNQIQNVMDSYKNTLSFLNDNDNDHKVKTKISDANKKRNKLHTVEELITRIQNNANTQNSLFQHLAKQGDVNGHKLTAGRMDNFYPIQGTNDYGGALQLRINGNPIAAYVHIHFNRGTGVTFAHLKASHFDSGKARTNTFYENSYLLKRFAQTPFKKIKANNNTGIAFNSTTLANYIDANGGSVYI
ncbi:MAG TPA: hypothetical protein DCS93_08100 [Microscillaceae bacterium]|nr:hypothetical protein [Microscillaceae bacterium]